MSDLIFQFSQQVPKDTLTQIGAGISGIAHEREAERVLRSNQFSYDQLLQGYMDDPSEQNLMNLNQAAIPLGLTDETTAAVGQVQQIRANRAAAELLEQQTATYNDALGTWMRDKSDENWMALLEAGSPLGKFDDLIKSTSQLAQNEVEQEVQEIVSILAHTRIGDGEGGAAAAELLAVSYENRGTPEDLGTAKGYREMAGLLRDGKVDEVDAMLSMEGGTLGDYGRNAMTNIRDFAAEERAREKLTIDQVMTAIEIEIPDEARRAELRAIVGELENSSDLAMLLVDLATLADELEEDPDTDVLSRVIALRQQYMRETVEYQHVNEQNATVRQAALRALTLKGLYGNDAEAVGVADTAIVNAFQRMIDDAVVRGEDFKNLRTTVGPLSLEGLELLAAEWIEGDKLNNSQRRALLQMAGQIAATYERTERRARDFVDEEAPRLNRTTEQVVGDLIFNPYDEAQQLQEYKTVLEGIYPTRSNDIRGLSSLQEMEQQFGRAYGFLTGDTVEAEADTATVEAVEDQDTFEWGGSD